MGVCRPLVIVAGMKLIGLTGGIGSGKTTVAEIFSDRGVPVIDADAIAREIVEPGEPALRELADAFGEDVIDKHGALNRGLLAQRAFQDAEHTQLLNDITHPRINAETQCRFEKAAAAGEDAVVYDMPLLVDKGLHKGMDYTVVVDVDAETRVQRLVASRGLDEDDARRRIAAQISDAERLAAADLVIDNNGPREELAPQVDAVLAAIRK